MPPDHHAHHFTNTDAALVLGATVSSAAIGDRLIAGAIGLAFALAGGVLLKLADPWIQRLQKRLSPRD